MAIRPSVPEIITVNSEALQTTIRDLLPSQNGFGSELQASNVITPIIDLTATAAAKRSTKKFKKATTDSKKAVKKEFNLKKKCIELQILSRKIIMEKYPMFSPPPE